MPARLITIPMSHFCEKGRWTLDHAGIAYDEDGWPPGLHLAAILPRRAETTPVLVMNGDTLRGSDRVLAYAAERGAGDLIPDDPDERAEVERWVTIADTRLGIESRRWFYSWATSEPQLLKDMVEVNARGWRGPVAGATLSVSGPMIRRRFDVDRTTRFEAAERVRTVFAEADAARSDDSPYLVGGRFTAADLAFAALGAPMVFPEGYGPSGALTFEDLPEAMRTEVETWRSEPSGRAIELVYARHRRPTGQ